jgi:hypothetical protein
MVIAKVAFKICLPMLRRRNYSYGRILAIVFVSQALYSKPNDESV